MHQKFNKGYNPERSRRAFTLIELLVVCAMIGILATVVIINLMGAKATSRYAKTVAEMTEMAKAVNLYKVTNGVWPEGWSGIGSDSNPLYIFNNTTTGDGANKFLVDMFGSKIPDPECNGAHYAYYIKYSDPLAGYLAIFYFPVNSGTKAAVVDVGAGVTAIQLTGENPSIDIRNKITKQITCKETAANFNN